MTATYMDRPSKRIWCAIEGVEALSTDAAEAALTEFEMGKGDLAEDVDDIEDGADELPDADDEDIVDEADESDVDDEELEEADPAESDAEDDPEEDDDEGGEEVDDEPETVIETPQFWDAEGKAVFAKLQETLKAAPKELRPIVAELAEQVNRNEKQRNVALSRKLEEAATARKVAEQAAEKLDGFISDTDKALEYYEGVDWVAEAQRTDPAIYAKHRAQFDALKDAKAKAEAAKKEAEQQEFQHFVYTETQNLQRQAPEFFDPKTGAQLRAEVQSHLANFGYTPETLARASANDLIIAKESMLWRKAQAEAKKATNPKPVAGKAKRKGLKPSAAKPPASSKQALRKKINSSSSLSTDDAVNALLALNA